MITYRLVRCARCKVQLEPAPFGTPENDEDWGHPVGNGEKCWPEDDPPMPLFKPERIDIEVDDGGDVVRLITHENGEAHEPG